MIYSNAQMTETRKQLDENRKKRKAREAAIRRRSKACPVIKALDSAIDGEMIDIQHGIDLMIISISDMPEGAATVQLLNKLKLKAGVF